MREKVFWYSQKEAQPVPALGENLTTDAVVVGGGIAGLSCAQWLKEEAKLDVVVLEARFCGAGASGKSSGFITPDSELELNQLARRFGDDDAKRLWQASRDGCEQIRRNIRRFQIDCGYIEADSLYVANGRKAFSVIEKEHEAHQRLDFPSQLYQSKDLPGVLGSDGYDGGVRYGDTFGINSFAYVQGFKDALVKQGVAVFENSPAVEITRNLVRTPHGSVRAKQVFICMDKYAPQLEIAARDDYHAQTFLIVSEPLSADIREKIFPENPLMIWDTDLIYQYFRLTDDNRLLVGGGLLRETFQPNKSHHSRAVKHIVSYIRRKFPILEDVNFTDYWAGLIGVTKDLLPLAGQSADEPSHFYAMCSAGLPWSTLAGRVAARKAVEGATEFDEFFSPARAFNFIEPFQPLIAKPLTFALSHYYAKNYQRGHQPQVVRRKDLVLAGLCLLSAAGGAGIALSTGKKKSKLIRRRKKWKIN